MAVVTIRDVAEAAGVSVATVSRIASGSDYPVGARTRERVEAVIEALGYRPNQSATDLSRRDTHLVGVVAPDMANQYYAQVTRGIEDAAHAAGYQVLFSSTDRRRTRAAAALEALLRRRVAALVVLGGGEEIRLTPEHVAPYGTEVVLVGRPSETFSTVQADGVRAGQVMAEHFLGLGHERVAFLAGSRGSTATRLRQQGVRRVLRTAGLEPPATARGGYTEEGGYTAAMELLQAAARPTAIIAANDRMAIGAMAAAHDLGLSVPDDVALAGFDDTPISAYVRPALTTYSLRSGRLGAEAMQLILEREEGDTSTRHRTVDGEIVVRASCGARPAADGEPRAARSART
ncbi:LacI family DNA-binding transcriptional regulator [Georgenia alba]|uniref:LacI family DNA-binding transcriptional regulator n=1 Tax=Georgenia alba TaxID=2233858 RepID=A0ABW2Q8G3_9MICO